MIFMSQSGITDPGRSKDWDEWYVEHLKVMASVPGVSSAQRFKSSTPGAPPSLATYTFASGDVFKDPYYLSVRGMGEWSALIDKRYYRRNLFDGLEHAPTLGQEERLLVADREGPHESVAGVTWIWLRCVGIDRSTAFRGIAVVPSAAAAGLLQTDIAVYVPATACYKPL